MKPKLTLPLAALAAALVVPGAAHAAATPAVAGDLLTITGDAANDNIALTVQGGLIAHNLPTAAGALEDGTDFDPGPGIVTLPSDGTIRLAVDGGAGNDNINVSGPTFAGNPALDGGDGDDVIVGSPQVDAIDGGPGNDRITGFRGGETINGGDGNDTIIWNNGDGNDVNVGGAGVDETLVTTGSADDVINVTPNGARFLLQRVNAPFSVDSEAVERLTVTSFSGNDTVTADPAVTVPMTIDAGPGDDAITTGGGADLINGGDGNDTLNGAGGGDRIVADRGADTANGGDGDDTLVWNNGDGSDVLNGDAGVDRVETNLGAGDDVSTLKVENGRVRYDRTSAGAFNLSIGSAETFELNSLGGNDSLTSWPSLPITVVADGGAGDDRFEVRDGAPSFVFGGSGADTAVADLTDAIAGDVETVDRAKAAVAGGATLAKAATVRRGVALLRVSCPAGSSGCQGTIGLTSTKRLRAGKVRATLQIGRASFNLKPGQRNRVVRMRLAPGTRLLARNRRLTVNSRVFSKGAVERSGKLVLRF